MKLQSSPLFDQSPVPAMIVEPEGTVAAFNAAARRVLGVQPDRVLGRPLLSRIVGEDREHAKEQFLRVLQGQVCEFTARFKRGDAAVRIQRVRAALHAPDGTPEAIMVFLRDITESREGRPETHQLQTLLENLPSQFTTVVDTRMRIRYSSGLARLHFRDDLEIVGEEFRLLLDPNQDVESALREISGILSRGDHWKGTLWHRRADGLTFPVHMYASPYFDPTSGRQLGALIVGRDATDEENWRRRAFKAEHFATIGRMVVDVTREIDAGLVRLERAIAAPEPRARVELKRLDGLASAIHQLSMVADLQKRQVPLRDIIDEATGSMASIWADRSISLHVDIPPEIGPVVGDREQIGVIFSILLTNAVENLEGETAGEIRIEARADDQAVASIRVSDSGPPMNEEATERAFDILYSSKRGGLGMGLPLARSIVNAHGGKMWSETSPEGRTFFGFQLPRPESPETFKPTPLRVNSQRKVLVVDDEEDVRNALRRFLEKVGFEVREAWSGRSAIAQLTTGRPPEIVLTDLMMDDGSGTWFLRQLMDDFPDLIRRTVLITGNPEQAKAQDLVRRTGCPVLTKPIDLPELLEALDEIGDRERLTADVI